MTPKLSKPRFPAIRRPLIAALALCAAAVSAGLFAVPAHAVGNVYDVAYEGTNGDLWWYSSTTTTSNLHDSHLGMNIYTAPSIAMTGSGPEVAFESNQNQLWLFDPGNGLGINTGLDMEPSTTPSIAQNDMVAFEGSNGHLWYYDGNVGHDTELGMDSTTTSPSLTLEGREIAFQANTHDLWTYDIATLHGVNTGLGMDPDSSPSIGYSQTGDPWVAFEANTNDLWYYHDGTGYRVPLGMAPATSPSLSPSSTVIAFQANTGKLWLYQVGGSSSTSTNLGMSAGVSPDLGPSIEPGSGTISGYQVWWQASGSHHLWQYTTNTGVGVDAGATVSSNSHGVAYTQAVSFNPVG
jgi:hypothetical protein